MSRLISFYNQSLDELRHRLPVFAALIALRADEGGIADCIPGLGTCKSTYCQPRRVAIGRANLA